MSVVGGRGNEDTFSLSKTSGEVYREGSVAGSRGLETPFESITHFIHSRALKEVVCQGIHFWESEPLELLLYLHLSLFASYREQTHRGCHRQTLGGWKHIQGATETCRS